MPEITATTPSAEELVLFIDAAFCKSLLSGSGDRSLWSIAEALLARYHVTARTKEPEPVTMRDSPFGPVPVVTGWRAAPVCGSCNDTGRTKVPFDSHCSCKRGMRMSELWYADKHGFSHPDQPEPSEPDYADEEPTT